MAVVDTQTATSTAFGAWIAARASDEGTMIGWAVRPDDLDATAARLGLRIEAGARRRPSGDVVEWRMAGVDAAARRPWLPFFVEWAVPTAFPGATPSPPAAIASLEIEGDERELSDWLAAHDLPIVVRAGDRGITRLELDGPGGRFAVSG